MSFGFSVGDFLTAMNLAGKIYSTCFSSISGAHLAYYEYGRQIKLFSESIQSLWHILSEHEKKIDKRRRGARLVVDQVDLGVLAEIIGDFNGTLTRTEKLLDNSSVFRRDGRGYITRIKWTLQTEEQVQQLTQNCAFHIAKIQFVIKPLELKLLMDISTQIEDSHEGLMRKMDEIVLLISNPEGKGKKALPELRTEEATLSEQLPEASARFSRLITPSKLIEKFKETLQTHHRYRSMTPEIPLNEWTEAAAWWIENSTGKFVKSRHTPEEELPPELYLNILKAAWLLSKVEDTMEFKRLPTESLWIKYTCELSESILDEIASFKARGLIIPDEDKLLRLPDECFLVWKSDPEKESDLTFHAERLGEEKLLELPLGASLDPDRFARMLLVFRTGEDILRICDTTEDLESGSQRVEGFPLVCAETELIALYIARYNPCQPVYNLMVKNRLQCRDYSFRCIEDLHLFQRAITGSLVAFDLPGQKNVTFAPRLGTNLEGTQVRVQIWQEKPLNKQPNGASVTSGGSSLTPSSPLLTRVPTYYSGSGSSGSSSSSGLASSFIEFTLPTAPILTIFLKAKGGWTFVQIPMEDALEIKPKRCCSSMSRIYRSEPNNKICCLRTVIEASEGRIDALVFSPEKSDADWKIDILQAASSNSKKKAGKNAHFKYISFVFSSDEEKLKFNKGFESMKNLRKAQRAKINKQLQEARKNAVSKASTWDTASRSIDLIPRQNTIRSFI